MQFKNPEILYFLLVLIIPILIHLFQLQRFQKVAFTNVKLLKEIEQKTRKSSKLKKLLILLSRLLLFASLIFAFAQPYFSKKNNHLKAETFIYLDNSFSMQAKGESGDLLQKAKNDLIKNLPDKLNSTTLITNDQILKNLNSDAFKNEIIKIDFHPEKKDLKTVLLQIDNLKSKKVKTSDKVLLISDFQKININTNELKLDSSATYSFIQTRPNNFENIAIDSVWISDENNENIQIKSLIKSYQLPVKNLSVSLYIDDKLYGKTTVNIDKNNQSEIEFRIPNTKNIQGKLTLNDNKLKFDNVLYFSILAKEKTNVLAIEEDQGFLSKIYTEDEFNFTSTALTSLDYNVISSQQIIVLNELDQFPNSLIQALISFLQNEGNIVVIPSQKSDVLSYNKLFSALKIGNIKALNESKKAVTLINYKHPFFKNVFQKQVTNFQYPTVKSFFETSFLSTSSLLQFEDKSDFISEIKWNNSKLYWFASPLNTNNSNFISSPLVVPVFYNFSLQNYSQKKLFYTIASNNEIIIKTNTKNDDVLHMVKKELDFIPLQSKTTNYIKIQTDKEPLDNGIYKIMDKANVIQHIAYNYNREESSIEDFPINNLIEKNTNSQYFTSLNNALKKINDQYKNQNLWQLFIIFALLFLGLEIIFHKFMKS